MFTAGLVLAAGRSARLGRPKQTLGYRGGTLLGATLDMARSCGFDQLLVVIGGAADEVRAMVDTTGCTVIENVDHRDGCSSSIAASLAAVEGRAPYKFSPLTVRWSERSEWDRGVYDLALKTFLSQSQEQQARSAPVMLLCAKRAGIKRS